MKLHFFPRSRGTSMNRAGRHLLALFTACVLISAPAAAAGPGGGTHGAAASVALAVFPAYGAP